MGQEIFAVQVYPHFHDMTDALGRGLGKDQFYLLTPKTFGGVAVEKEKDRHRGKLPDKSVESDWYHGQPIWEVFL